MMRSFSAGVLFVSLAVSASSQQPVSPSSSTPKPSAVNPAVTDEPPRQATPNTLMDGTTIMLRLSETISSADAHVGQQVSFEVTEDVVVQGVTVIPKGSPALATVTIAEGKKRMGRGGKLDVNIDSVRLVDGEKVQLRAVKNTKGGGHVGAMTGAMVATGIVFFPAAPLFLLMHGKDITIPKGTEITSFVQGDMKLDMAKFRGGSAPTEALAATTVMASLTVESSMAGADIEVDGVFVGSTPSTISVTTGQHTITVKKQGYADWTRKMNVSGTSVHLNADLGQAAVATK